MDIGANVVSRWVREAKADKVHAFPGRGQQKPEDAEIARLNGSWPAPKPSEIF